jgi:hypothetical protein
MICIHGVRKFYGAFSDCGPLAQDSAPKLKRGQLNVYNGYVLSVLFFPRAEIFARLACNFCQ